jgi:hypothetical protein
MLPLRDRLELRSRHKPLEESLAITYNTTVPRNISTV